MEAELKQAKAEAEGASRTKSSFFFPLLSSPFPFFKRVCADISPRRRTTAEFITTILLSSTFSSFFFFSFKGLNLGGDGDPPNVPATFLSPFL